MVDCVSFLVLCRPTVMLLSDNSTSVQGSRCMYQHADKSLQKTAMVVGVGLSSVSQIIKLGLISGSPSSQPQGEMRSIKKDNAEKRSSTKNQ